MRARRDRSRFRKSAARSRGNRPYNHRCAARSSARRPRAATRARPSRRRRTSSRSKEPRQAEEHRDREGHRAHALRDRLRLAFGAHVIERDEIADRERAARGVRGNHQDYCTNRRQRREALPLQRERDDERDRPECADARIVHDAQHVVARVAAAEGIGAIGKSVFVKCAGEQKRRGHRKQHRDACGNTRSAARYTSAATPPTIAPTSGKYRAAAFR